MISILNSVWKKTQQEKKNSAAKKKAEKEASSTKDSEAATTSSADKEKENDDDDCMVVDAEKEVIKIFRGKDVKSPRIYQGQRGHWILISCFINFGYFSLNLTWLPIFPTNIMYNIAHLINNEYLSYLKILIFTFFSEGRKGRKLKYRIAGYNISLATQYLLIDHVTYFTGLAL